MSLITTLKKVGKALLNPFAEAEKKGAVIHKGTLPISPVGGGISTPSKVASSVSKVGGKISSAASSLGKFVGKSFIASPVKTTIALASVPTAIGIATTPQFRGFIAGGFQRGRQLPAQLQSIGGGVKDFFTSPAGLVTAGAGAVGGTLLTKEIIERFTERDTITAGASPIVTLTPDAPTLGAVAPVKEAVESPVEVKSPVKPIKVSQKTQIELTQKVYKVGSTDIKRTRVYNYGRRKRN